MSPLLGARPSFPRTFLRDGRPRSHSAIRPALWPARPNQCRSKETPGSEIPEGKLKAESPTPRSINERRSFAQRDRQSRREEVEWLPEGSSGAWVRSGEYLLGRGKDVEGKVEVGRGMSQSADGNPLHAGFRIIPDLLKRYPA